MTVDREDSAANNPDPYVGIQVSRASIKRLVRALALGSRGVCYAVGASGGAVTLITWYSGR